ncbi:MAG TPA: hypothetical protein VKA10_06340 [Prolixibacteraceae bacterium]|nr:hypothetical protein [Prolixibacteraceae bacterium]
MTESNKAKPQNASKNFDFFDIIIVEDDKEIGKLIQTKLKKLGYNVKPVETGYDALKTVTGNKN